MINFEEHFDKILPGYFETMTDEEFMLAMYYGIMPTKGILGFLGAIEYIKNVTIERNAKAIAQHISAEVIDELRALANEKNINKN